MLVCSYLFIDVVSEEFGGRRSGEHLQLMKGPPSPWVFFGFRFRAIEWDVAGPAVCEASAPSHARLRAGSCEKLAQAAELPHGLLLLRAHALLFPLTMLFPSAFANEDLVCFF